MNRSRIQISVVNMINWPAIYKIRHLGFSCTEPYNYTQI